MRSPAPAVACVARRERFLLVPGQLTLRHVLAADVALIRLGETLDAEQLAGLAIFGQTLPVGTR